MEIVWGKAKQRFIHQFGNVEANQRISGPRAAMEQLEKDGIVVLEKPKREAAKAETTTDAEVNTEAEPETQVESAPVQQRPAKQTTKAGKRRA